MDLMLELQRERGLGFLWITHDLAVASQVCERLLVVYGGATMETGPMSRLLTAPRHPYTTRLLQAARRQPCDDAGFLPSPQDRPPGCPFQPRCESRQASCAHWEPWQGTLDEGLRCERPLALPD